MTTSKISRNFKHQAKIQLKSRDDVSALNRKLSTHALE